MTLGAASLPAHMPTRASGRMRPIQQEPRSTCKYLLFFFHVCKHNTPGLHLLLPTAALTLVHVQVCYKVWALTPAPCSKPQSLKPSFLFWTSIPTLCNCQACAAHPLQMVHTSNNLGSILSAAWSMEVIATVVRENSKGAEN